MSTALKVIRGNPTDEELAAIVGVIAALPREEVSDETGPSRNRAAWSNPGLRLRVRRSWREAAVPARRGMDR